MPSGFEFDAPHWLWLWPALLLLAFIWRRLSGPGEPAGLAAGSIAPPGYRHPLAALLATQQLSTRRTPRWKRLLWWLALAAMTLALAQPVRIGERLPEPPLQRDIVFIVDTSVGMLLSDYRLEGREVRRIDLLRQALAQLSLGLSGDRLGIVVFGTEAHTLVPLTSDHRLLRQMLPRISTDIAGRASAIGDAVAMAVREAERTPGGEERILVLFSDAQLQAGKIAPLAAAELAAEAGLELYTVAIGATGNDDGTESTQGGLVYHPAELALLQALAERTGARSYHASNSEALQQAVRDITARRASARQQQPEYARLSHYHWPLLLAVVLLLLCQLPPRRRGRRT